MSITLSVGAVSVELPEDLYWEDELAWSPVVQSESTSLTGALILQTGLRQAGRHITLEPPLATRSSWMTRADLEQLFAWAEEPGLQLTLQLRGASHTVVWRHQEPPVIRAEPVQHYSDVASEDLYTATLRFLEI